jgi:hypothetical protein
VLGRNGLADWYWAVKIKYVQREFLVVDDNGLDYGNSTVCRRGCGSPSRLGSFWETPCQRQF